MMLRRLLLVLIALSLLAAIAASIIWGTSYSHLLHFGFNAGRSHYEFTSHDGNIFFTHSQNFGDMISSTSVNYSHKRLLIALLLVPVVAGLIEIRRRIPRPGRGGAVKADRPLGNVR